MTTKEKKTLCARVIDIRDLLSEFGLRLSGIDPGVTAFFLDPSKQKHGIGWAGEPFTLGRAEWEWLEPLLRELREYRDAVQDLQGKSHIG